MTNKIDTVVLGDLLSEDRGISVGVMYPGEHDPAGIPLIRCGDLAGDRINSEPTFQISPAVHNEYRRSELSGGELLMSLVGNVGLCAVVPSSMRGWNAARAVAVMRFRDPNDAYFVRFAIKSPNIRHLIDVWSNTTVQQTLNLKEIKRLPIPWPSSSQRRNTAEILGALDDKIELNRRMNETLEAMARAIFKDWFVDFGPTQAKMERRAPYLAPEVWQLFPDRLGDEENPHGWDTSTIGDEVAVVGGSTPSTKEPAFWNGDIYWTTPKDLSTLSSPVLLGSERTITAEGLAQISSGLLPVGAVLLSSRAPIGYLVVAQVPTAINQGFIGMICNNRLSNVFVWLWTKENHDLIVQHANGSTFLEISKSNFRPLPIIVPSDPVLQAFDEIATPLFDRIVNNEKEIATLAATRDLLLPKFMSGEIHVKHAEKIAEEVL